MIFYLQLGGGTGILKDIGKSLLGFIGYNKWKDENNLLLDEARGFVNTLAGRNLLSTTETKKKEEEARAVARAAMTKEIADNTAKSVEYLKELNETIKRIL